MWARVLIGRIAAGHEVEKARNMEGSKVSLAIIQRAQIELTGFNDAFLDAKAGRYVVGAETLRENARAYSSDVLASAYSMARNVDPETGERMAMPIVSPKTGEVIGHRDAVAPRDRAMFSRIVLEAGQVITHGPAVAVQVNVGWSHMATPGPASVPKATVVDVPPADSKG